MGDGGFLRAQLQLARTVLKSAWNDFYFSTYTWTIVKARDAARHALTAVLRESGMNPQSSWPTSLLLESAASACSSLSLLGRESLRLDYLANLYTDTELYLILWYASAREEPPRRAALSSLEASIKIVEAVENCGSLGEAADARGRLAASLYDAKYLGRYTVFVSGPKLYVTSTAYEGVDPLDRLELSSSLPLGFTPILLSPDEAYALLNLPWPFEHEAEVVEDKLRLAPLVKKRNPGLLDL